MAKLEIDEQLVRKLADLLKETGLTELEYEVGNHRIRLNRGSVAPAAALPPAAAPASAAAAPSAPAAGAEAPPNGAVLAPMVGTVYTGPQPGAAPFIETGARVSKGDTLLIIEAMKVMNPIIAPRDGTITAILVADGQPVEFGEVLVVLQ